MDETVSVVITTHYRNDRLSDAIRSVREQTYSPVEALVVDDSGEAHAEPVVAPHDDVRYVAHGSNRGQIAAWHTGLEHAGGGYVQFLDDDDYLHGEKIRKQVELLRENGAAGVAYCGAVTRRWGIVSPDPELRGDVLERVLTLRTPSCQTSTMLMEQGPLADAFPMTEYGGATDNALKIELARRTEFDFVGEPLVRRYFDGDNISETMSPAEAQWEMIEDYADLYEDARPETASIAVGSTYFRQGHACFEGSYWSPGGLASFALGNYHAPGIEPAKLILLFLALFGDAGRRAGRRLDDVAQSR